MVHEISQFDIPDRQLLETSEPPRAGIRSDIGEAKITHTVFGGARVRVICEKDKKRRAWLLAALVVTALAAAAWQGWIAYQKSLLIVVPLPLSERIRISAPVFQPEEVAPAPATRSAKHHQRTPMEILLDSMATRRPPEPQQMLGLKASGQKAAKPVGAQPSIASKPLNASPSTNNNSAKVQTGVQQSPQLSTQIHPEAPLDSIPPGIQTQAPRPAVAASPVTPNRPAAAAPAAKQLVKENDPALSSSGNNQPSEPDDAKP